MTTSTTVLGRFAALVAALWVVPSHGQEARLLRFPAIHGDRVVFSHAGDLYTVAASGGIARRLTSHEGYETFPRFSPDGKTIAFTGQYDGNTEVFLMPSEGGAPRRLTYTPTLSRDDVSDRMGPNNIVMTWRDATHVVFRTRGYEWNPFKGELFSVSVTGELPEELPLPRGGWCSFSPDGKRMAYNRVFREFRTWKRYRGGQADDVWIYDFEGKTTVNITENPAQDVFPMWHGERIYFLSDRDDSRRFNVFVHDVAQRTTRQVTSFTDFDCKFPSLGDQAIVFENGGYIYRMDLATEEVHRIPVEFREDFAGSRGGLTDVSRRVSSFDLAPDGNRAVFGARGDVFTVPAKYGEIRNLTRTPGVHERNSRWSPDGRWIAWVSDASDADEIYLSPQDGSGPAVQITTNADTYKYELEWSPDSGKILWSDKRQRLQFVDVTSRQVTVVVSNASWEMHDYSWSPDSRWVAYSRPEERQMQTIQLYSLESGQTIPVTDRWFASREPVFSADGKYLFFVSNRDFAPRSGQLEYDFGYYDMANVYFVTLAKATPSPLAPKSDEVKIKTEAPKKEGENQDKASPTETSKPDTDHASAEKQDEAKGGRAEAKEAKKDEKKPVTVQVDAEGLMQRIAVLPLPASEYRRLASVGDKLYYVRHGSREDQSHLLLFDLEKRKETDLGAFGGYVISADTKKMLVPSGGGYAIVDLPNGKIDVKDRLDLGNLKVTLDRPAEWSQIYQECWRQMRDFVYDPQLHQVDWNAMKARYEPLLAHVHHRADLTYVIGELIGELNLGHSYVGGGDYPKPDRVPLGLLGARISRDRATGFFRVDRILAGQNWDSQLRSPLTEIGVDVKVGDYIVEVNGRPVNEVPNLYTALVDTAGKQVKLKVNSEPKAEGARETVVVPTDDEQPLYYFNWVQKNIARVSQATGGRIGYVHIPDMGVPGMNEFAKYFYPQTDKEGLIVDVRGNGGGNVSAQIMERLRREPAMFTIARNGTVNVDPAGMVLGPKVMLLDEFSASDGDIVAYRFKKYKLGPVVGKRSWGGVVGIRGSLPLLDGGSLNRPEFSRFDLEGKEWIMEGKGVEPDIVVDNDPAREYAGIDDQLERAIAEILQALKTKSVPVPPVPPYPDKSR